MGNNSAALRQASSVVKVPAFEGGHEAALPVRAGGDLGPLTETSWGCMFFGLGHLPPFPLPIEAVPAFWDGERHRFLGSPLCSGLQSLTPGPKAWRWSASEPGAVGKGCAPGLPWGVNGLFLKVVSPGVLRSNVLREGLAPKMFSSVWIGDLPLQHSNQP